MHNVHPSSYLSGHFNVQVNDRQKELNMEAAKIINEKCISKEIKLEGYKNLAKGLIYK